MKKVYECINVMYYYDSREERDEHVHQMSLEGWECSGQIKETLSFHTDKWTYVGKFSKYVE